MTIEAGQQLLHYRLTRKIGEGGMGAVWEAEDLRLDRRVAVKILPRELTRASEGSARFRQEAKLAASFNHPNIATIHDVGEQDGITFFVMELLRGDSLRDLVGGTGLPVPQAIDYAIGIAAGLARAHAEGIVHRDLKPDNVVLDDEGTPKILDFGVGKLLDETEQHGDVPHADPDMATVAESPYVTRHGQVVGTLGYMSPEQIQGRPVDVRADVFSFGVLLYEMLAGTRPFAGTTGLETATAILRDEPAGLKQQLEGSGSGQPSVLGRPAVLAGALVLLVAIGAGLISVLGDEDRESWARNEALPEIERLWNEGDRDGAIRLAYEAESIIPDDPRLQRYLTNIAVPVDVESDPSGAVVYVKGYDHPERDWIRVGETPITDKSLGMPVRFRVEKEGYAPFEGSPFAMDILIPLFPEEEIPTGMVFVPAGAASLGDTGSIEIGEFWIDRCEVTNREYKVFVDAGGYREAEYWDDDVDRERLVDSTGRPGPAGWALGDYPEGEDDFPVGGVSWYEAKAYAAWAQKSLPTVFHWRVAAQQGIFSEILRWSNFDTKGPAKVGSYGGIGPNGTYDMAGNVREWCLNQSVDRQGQWLPLHEDQRSLAGPDAAGHRVYGLRSSAGCPHRRRHLRDRGAELRLR
jgi:serine/threonine protein kinase